MAELNFMPGESGGMPTFLKKRRNPLESFLERLKPPDFGAPEPEPTPTIDSTTPRELPDKPMGIPVGPSLGEDMVKAQPRLDGLQRQHDAIGRMPQTFKGKLGMALATAAPTALGAIFGGTSGAAGAAEGTGQFFDNQRDQQNLQRRSLEVEMENERQRQERMQERKITVDAQTRGHDLADATRRDSLGIDMARNAETARHNQAMEGAKNSADAATLRAKGLKRDAQGNVVPVTREEMGPEELSKLDASDAGIALKKAQIELDQATEALRRVQADPNSPQYQLARARVATAQQNSAIAQQRLGLSQQQFEARAFGTNNGVPLPGAMITDDDTPVGSSFQQNVRPTGTERNKADLGTSAKQKVAELKSIVQKRPDIFGPAPGRVTDLNVWLGSQDPDAQRFIAARNMMVDHLAGVFGGRSEAALNDLKNAAGTFKDNPSAILAGLDELDKGADVFVNAGTVRTVGSNAGKKSLGKDLGATPTPREAMILQYLKRAGGDKEKARALAKADGHPF